MINYTSSPFSDPDGDTLTLSQTGLPAPLTFVDNGDGTYSINGTAPSSGGPWAVVITADDGNGGTVSQTLTIDCGTQNAPPTNPPTGPFTDTQVESTAFTGTTHGTWTGTGTGPITLTASGLPAWVTFNDNGDGTYYLSGTTPAVSGNQNYTYTVTASNAAGASAPVTGHTIIVTDNTGTGGGGGDGCFIAMTQVLMGDGQLKSISEIQIGESVQSISGEAVRVTRRHEIEYQGDLYGFNGGSPFFTAGHPFMTKTGWVSMNPDISRQESPGIDVSKMKAGQVLSTETGLIKIETLSPRNGTGEIVYNITVDQHTFIANGYHVHNSINKN